MKAIVVEDSRLARLELTEQLKSHHDIELIGEAENVPEALNLIKQNKPDLIFLDIHMPKQTGFDLLEQLDFTPMVIFTTAFSEHAIKSFEYDVVDYLLKPITTKRLNKAIEKARLKFNLSKPDTLDIQSQFYVKDGNTTWFIKLSEVSLFESMGNYTRIHFNDAKPMIYKSLSLLETRLPKQLFFRVNRNQIINVNRITGIESNVGASIEISLDNDTCVEVSRRQTAEFKKIWSL